MSSWSCFPSVHLGLMQPCPVQWQATPAVLHASAWPEPHHATPHLLCFHGGVGVVTASPLAVVVDEPCHVATLVTEEVTKTAAQSHDSVISGVVEGEWTDAVDEEAMAFFDDDDG